VSVATQADNIGYATRIAVDSFCLPLVAFYAARSQFDFTSHRKALLLGATVVAVFVFATGAFEMATGTDLFATEGSLLVRESEVRVNGPFQIDSSFSVIGLLLVVFLRAGPRLLKLNLDRGALVINWFGIACAAAAALMPLYRVAAIALVGSWLLVEIGMRSVPATRQEAQRRAWRLSPRLLILLLALVVSAGVAGLFIQPPEGRLASVRNIYGRLATWGAATQIALENPVLGVGLTNYNQYFNQRYTRSDQWLGAIENARPAAYPHSNPLWIASELGLAAFIIYVLANANLFFAAYPGLKREADPSQRAAAYCLAGLLAAYWIPGLTLTSGAFSDLNLYFFFLLGLAAQNVARAIPTNGAGVQGGRAGT
jgi:hypothetical protein